MQVKLTTDMATTGGLLRAGSRLEIDEEGGARLVAAGCAEACPFDARALAAAATPTPPPRPNQTKRDKR